MGKWTEEENQVIINNISRLSHSEIASLLPGRTENTVKVQAFRLKAFRKHSFSENQENKISTEKAAYIAGHFDGEGCLMMRFDGNVYKPEVSVANAYLPVLEMYQSLFSGTIKKHSVTVNKPVWSWRLFQYNSIIFFLRTIAPFSMEKREQILVLLEYAEVRVSKKKGKLDEATKLLSKECHEKLKLLKKI